MVQIDIIENDPRPILNLTLRRSTQEQLRDNVMDLPDEAFAELTELATFKKRPDRIDLLRRSNRIMRIAVRNRFQRALIGGDIPDFMIDELMHSLQIHGVDPLFSFFQMIDGRLQHAGFVRAREGCVKAIEVQFATMHDVRTSDQMQAELDKLRKDLDLLGLDSAEKFLNITETIAGHNMRVNKRLRAIEAARSYEVKP